jgi:hypothetical protein
MLNRRWFSWLFIFRIAVEEFKEVDRQASAAGPAGSTSAQHQTRLQDKANEIVHGYIRNGAEKQVSRRGWVGMFCSKTYMASKLRVSVPFLAGLAPL